MFTYTYTMIDLL